MTEPSSSSPPVVSLSTREAETLKPFEGHRGDILVVSYSPDGKQIAIGGWNPCIRIWDSDTGQLLLDLGSHKILSMCYSPDGTRLVSGDEYGTVCIWNTSDGQIILERVQVQPRLKTIAYSPDNKRIVTCGDDCMAHLWRAEDMTHLTETPEHPDEVESVSFSPDGSRLATGCCDYNIRIFDAATVTLVVGPLEGHTHGVRAVTYSPDGRQLASCSGDLTIRTWDALTGDALLTLLTDHTSLISGVAYSPSGSQLVSGSSDATICLWDSNTGELVAGPVRGHTSGVTAVSFAPDGTQLVTGSSWSMRVWNAQTLEIISPPLTEEEKNRYRLTGPFRGRTGSVNHVAYFPGGDRIASASEDGSIRVWDVHSGKEIGEPFIGYYPVQSMAISSDGMRLASGEGDFITVYDTLSSDIVLGPLEGHVNEVLCVRFSPDNQLIASSGHLGELFLWDSQTGEKLRNTQWRVTTIRSISFSPVDSPAVTMTNTFVSGMCRLHKS